MLAPERGPPAAGSPEAVGAAEDRGGAAADGGGAGRGLSVAPPLEDKLRGWTSGLRRAKAAAKGDGARVNKKSWAPAGAFADSGGDPRVEAALRSEGFKALQAERVLAYDPDVFPLQHAVLDMLAGAEPRIRETGLSQMHFAMDHKWDRSKSFKPHRRKFNG